MTSPTPPDPRRAGGARTRWKRQFRAAAASAAAESVTVGSIPPKYLRAMDQVLGALGGAPEVFAAAATSRSVFSRANIVGAGIGFKQTQGQSTGVLAVHVFVVKKLPVSQLDAELQVPQSVKVGAEDIPTDVIETGLITATPAAAPGFYTDRQRPAPCGASIGHPQVTAGTLGCLVAKDDGLYMLSNNHILAAVNRGKKGDLIYQPGKIDAGGTPSSNVIARLEHMHAIDFSPGAANQVDAALAMTNDDDTTPDMEDGTTLDDPTPLDAFVGMAVQKVGRTTGPTQGQVMSVQGRLNCGYEGGQTAQYTNQIVIQSNDGSPFSQGGDSGSLIMSVNPAQPVALLFSGDTAGHTYANPIQTVMDALGGFDVIAVFGGGS
jgi:hypothetical protein